MTQEFTVNRFAKLAAVESRLVMREPLVPLLALALPILLMIAFGLPSGARDADPNLDGARPIDTVLPSLALSITVAIIGISFLPATLGIYREKGVLRRLSTTPVHPAGLLAAQAVVYAVIAVVAVGLVLGVGGSALDMAMPDRPLGFVAAFLLGLTSSFGLGLLIAAAAPTGRAANAIGMLLFFPSLFLAGVYLPKEQMPHFLQRICDFTPLGAFRQSVQDAWVGTGPQIEHLGVLAGFTVVFGLGAARLFRWE